MRNGETFFDKMKKSGLCCVRTQARSTEVELRKQRRGKKIRSGGKKCGSL